MISASRLITAPKLSTANGAPQMPASASRPCTASEAKACSSTCGRPAHSSATSTPGLAWPYADAKHGNAITGLDARLAQRVEGSRARTQLDCRSRRAHAVGDRDCIARRRHHVLGVAAIEMLADHLPMTTELFESVRAVIAMAAAHEVMQGHALAQRKAVDAAAQFVDAPCDLVTWRDRSVGDTRGAGTVMRIGMTDDCRFDLDADLVGSRLRQRHLAQLQGFPEFDDLHGFHG